MSSAYEQIKNDFLIKYEKNKKNIILILKSFEKENQEINRIKKGLIISAAALAIFIVFSVFCNYFMFFLPVFGLFISFFIYVFIMHYEARNNKLEEELDKLMPLICSCFENLKWNMKFRKTKERYQKEYLFTFLCAKLKLLPTPDTKYMCTFITPFSGVWHNIAFDISQTEFYPKNKNNNCIRQVIIGMTFNKKFNSHTLITMDTKSHKPPEENLKHTELEDVVFEKKFDVFTNDPIEARYLITTAFMERLNNTSKVFKGNLYSCAFLNDKFYIAFSVQEEFFNITNIGTSLEKKEEEISDFFEQILSIYKLIDYFTTTATNTSTKENFNS